MTEYVAWLHEGELPRDDVGGKGASLSNMMSAGFKVPDGFCITADAYRHFSAASGLDAAVAELVPSADLNDPAAVREVAGRLSALVEQATLPDDLRGGISRAYAELTERLGMPCAVRSSAISEDGSAASFAGLYESHLNVRGEDEVIDCVQRCYASLWSERAIGYRARRGGGADEAMSVVVMGLVPSETSGIAFTAHPVTGSLDHVVINASFGLGEAIVSGRVTPDSFVVQKGSFAVLEREIYPKTLAVYPCPDSGGVMEEQLRPDRQRAASLSDDQACDVARLAASVETHYGSPQDIEWGLYQGTLYLLQSRPITTLI